MYRLITFGGLSLVGDDERVSAAANQRSRLALLAVLAVAGHDEPDFQPLRTDAAFMESFGPRTGPLQLP